MEENVQVSASSFFASSNLSETSNGAGGSVGFSGHLATNPSQVSGLTAESAISTAHTSQDLIDCDTQIPGLHKFTVQRSATNPQQLQITPADLSRSSTHQINIPMTSLQASTAAGNLPSTSVVPSQTYTDSNANASMVPSYTNERTSSQTYANNDLDSEVEEPPQVFSASLNSSNLLSITGQDDAVSSDNLSVSRRHSTQDATRLHLQDPSSSHLRNADANLSNINGATNMQMDGSNMVSIQASLASMVQASQGGSLIQSSSNSFTDQQYSSENQLQSASHHMLINEQQQQPTYVLLQAPPDSETGAPGQVFLAMQTQITGQDPSQQAYITLQPVNLDGTDAGMTMVNTDNMSLNSTSMVQMPDMNQNTPTTPDKTPARPQPQLSTTIGGQQVLLNVPAGQHMLTGSGTTSEGQLVSYLQPTQTQTMAGMGSSGNGQVILSASDVQVLNRSTSGLLGMSRRRLSSDPRSCDQCGRTFKYPSDLKKHLQIHTDVKKFVCADCNRTFRRLHQLNVHRRIHTGEKPYVCQRCGAKFRHDSTLTMHIRTRHDHLKPFSCDGCQKKFGRMSHLRKHQRNVCGRANARGNNIIVCKYCELIFGKRSDLKHHLFTCEKKPDRLERGDLMTTSIFVCETCGKEFTRLYDFKRHQLSHTDEKPYHCPQCGKSFKERSSLNKHVKRMHCSDGDGTIPIDDDGIPLRDEDEESDDTDEDEEDLSDDGTIPENLVVSVSMNSKGKIDPASAQVTAQALAQAGIITNPDGQIMTSDGQTISAAEILNFPEVVAALGLQTNIAGGPLGDDPSHDGPQHPHTSSSHLTLQSLANPPSTGSLEARDLETSEVAMDMDSIDTDGGLSDGHHSHHQLDYSAMLNHPSSASSSLPGLPYDSADNGIVYVTPSNPHVSDSSHHHHQSVETGNGHHHMVFKQELDHEPLEHVPFQVKNEVEDRDDEDPCVSDINDQHQVYAHKVQAERAAEHDLMADDISTLLDTPTHNIISRSIMMGVGKDRSSFAS